MDSPDSKPQQKITRHKEKVQQPISKQEVLTVTQLIKDADKDTKIWALKKVKTIHPIIDDTVKSLAELDIIQYIRINDNEIQASSELAGNKRKIPETKAFHPSAVGINLTYDFEYKVMQIMEINSAIRGWGEKLVQASLNNLPQDWEVALVFDWSSGFWDKMKQKYTHVQWMRF